MASVLNVTCLDRRRRCVRDSVDEAPLHRLVKEYRIANWFVQDVGDDVIRKAPNAYEFTRLRPSPQQLSWKDILHLAKRIDGKGIEKA